jgi:hypothetical protein
MANGPRWGPETVTTPSSQHDMAQEWRWLRLARHDGSADLQTRICPSLTLVGVRPPTREASQTDLYLGTQVGEPWFRTVYGSHQKAVQ